MSQDAESQAGVGELHQGGPPRAGLGLVLFFLT